MPAYARRARRWALRLATAASIVLAVLLVWLFAPKAFGPLHTLELAGLLGLLILPGLTAWAVVADHRANARLTRAHVSG